MNNNAVNNQSPLAWGVTGNSGTTPGTNFIGTIDNKDVVFKRGGGFSGIIAVNTTFFGKACGNQTAADGSLANTGYGYGALQLVTSGDGNVAIGYGALGANTTGANNTAVGSTTISGNYSNCIILGSGATATASSQLVLGSVGIPLGTSTSANAGSNGDVPGQVLGYLNLNLNGTVVKIPYYDV